ncbi:hypothetical protein GCM10017083_40670 [Thalassobaculum fulvum]|uniref:Uncharacterized protein n=1 Tax=Thalassobaculum fulvum TaxID=1633335 RepID=A0A919CR93_9PROT|nr:hypothetical protein GCM10017083_40670 [Thalassobaculum fulvum]
MPRITAAVRLPTGAIEATTRGVSAAADGPVAARAAVAARTRLARACEKGRMALSTVPDCRDVIV